MGCEFLAEQYLGDRGYLVLARNFATRRGEVDLIVSRDGVVAFVEVRFRRAGRFGSPVETVTLAKRRKISIAAIEYVVSRGMEGLGIAFRFDILGITDDGGRIAFEHVENAFESAVRPFSASRREMG